MLQLYGELADWWPVLSPVEGYAEEAEYFLSLIDEAGVPPDASLLELGSGGGNNAFHMKKRFSSVMLSDLSADMLRISEGINPGCRHVVGDMRTIALDQRFDVVFIHDAIDYMTTQEDLFAVLRSVYQHCKPGGLAIFVPDHVRETYEESTDHGGSDAGERHLRYLEWSHDPDPTDTQTVVEYVVVYHIADGPVQVEHETHRCGLFSRNIWREGLAAAGFSVSSVVDEYEREIFLARNIHEDSSRG